MRKEDNPFAPGAGTQPPELVGREVVLEDGGVAIARALKGRPARSQIFYGLRGVGKTVLLRRLSELAVNRGAIVADLETPEDKRLEEILVPELRQALIQLNSLEGAKAAIKSAAGALQAFGSKFKVKVGPVGVEVKEPKGVADSGSLEKDVGELFVKVGEAAKAQETAIVLALDEMQYLSKGELSALLTAIHKTNQKQLPILLFGAGLPQLLGLAGDAKSYAERLIEFVEIGALSDEEARKAVRDPIVAEGAQISPAALTYIVERSKGYPYFIQEWGYRTWNAAQKSPITKEDALTAEQVTIKSLDKSFFRVRFDQLTKSEQDYLRAMAELGPGPHKSGEVAKLLGKKATQAGPVRSQVIAKGMAYGGQYGHVHFSVPIFDEFLKREIPEFKAKPPKKAVAKPKPATKKMPKKRGK